MYWVYLGLLFGLILGYSARRFKVEEEDPIVEKIDAILPQSQLWSVWSSWLPLSLGAEAVKLIMEK